MERYSQFSLPSGLEDDNISRYCYKFSLVCSILMVPFLRDSAELNKNCVYSLSGLEKEAWLGYLRVSYGV